MLISPEQIAQYHNEGYFILERAIAGDTLAGLRDECHRYIDKFDAEMEAKGVTTLGITHYKKRYFISNRGGESELITRFLFGDLMATIGRATLGDDVYLFNAIFNHRSESTNSHDSNRP